MLGRCTWKAKCSAAAGVLSEEAGHLEEKRKNLSAAHAMTKKTAMKMHWKLKYSHLVLWMEKSSRICRGHPI